MASNEKYILTLMADEEKRLVKDLRLHGLDNPSFLGTHMGLCDAAADLIEKLSADRDAWKRRAETAERDMGCMIPCTTCRWTAGESEACQTCAASILNNWRRSNYKWRGPCAENGGTV